MARLYSCGFELNSETDNMEYGDSFGSAASSIVTVGHLSGTYGYRVTAAGSADRDRPHVDLGSADSDLAHFMRFKLKLVDLADGATIIARITNTANAAKLHLQLETNGTITLRDGGANLIGTSSALNLDQWYRVEVRYFNNTGSGTAELTARIDGVDFATTTTETTNGGIRKFFIGPHDATTNYDLYIDDWAINDSSGSFQNSWPGEGEIIHLRPNAAGDNSAWSNDYQAVDEVTPDDATTIAESTTLDAIDDHNIDATPAALASNDTINCVQVGVRFRADGASEPGFVLRIKASAAGTVEESSEITPVDTAFHTNNIITFHQNYNLTLYDLPGASTTAWTKADLDAAQIGYRISTDATNNIEVSAVWLLVDHMPAVSSASPSVSPSQSPSASVSPSKSPSISPSKSPSVSPSASVSPSRSPSISPSISPSKSPSVSPSVSPSKSPSVSPSASPSASISPSVSPSAAPAPIHYLLNGTGIPRPTRMYREFIYVKQDFVNLSGRTTRDFSAQKEEFILQYDYVSQAEMAIFISLIALNIPITFEITEDNLTINETMVFPFIKRREYRTPGGSFIETIELTLIEQS